MTNLSASSSYSEIFDKDDPQFLETLCTITLPGDIHGSQDNYQRGHMNSMKRQRSANSIPKLSQEITDPVSQISSMSNREEITKKAKVTNDVYIIDTEHSHDKWSQRLNHEFQPNSQDVLESGSVTDKDGGLNTTNVKKCSSSFLNTSLPPSPVDKQLQFSMSVQMHHIPDTSASAQVPTITNGKDAACIPNYAMSKANEHAARLMQNAEFRSAHTSAGGAKFIEGFYKNSRLHHLSTWKAELKQLVVEAQERAEKVLAFGDELETETENIPEVEAKNSEHQMFIGNVKSEPLVLMRGNAFQLLRSSKGKGKEESTADDDTKDVIMHCDFDCFFASVGILDRPYLKNRPVVVCHSQGLQGGESSTSEVSCANYKAREFGIKNGMSLQQARKLCSSIVTIPYEFEKYKKISLQFYTILMSHADDLQAVSVDEALIDVTTAVRQVPPSLDRRRDPAKDFADMLRKKIKDSTGCEVSIGISHNIMLARLATRKAKPAGSFHLKLPDLQRYIEHMQVDELHGFGHSTRVKILEKLGVTTLGELAKKPKSILCDTLGKVTGETLYNAIRGIDGNKLESDKPRKSVSAEINYGIRFSASDQVKAFMFQLAEEVARRLDAIDMRGRSLALKVMKRDPAAPVEPPKFLGHGCCKVFNKQVSISTTDGRATSDAFLIGQCAWTLLKSFSIDPGELRGIGIQILKLEKANDDTKESSQLKLDFEPKLKLTESDKNDKIANTIYLRNPSTMTTQIPVSSDVELRESAMGSQQISISVLDLPSFSQVDRSAFEALPQELKEEIKLEFHRRSASPALSSTNDTSPSPTKRKTTNKGTPLSRITQALAPRSRSSLSSTKHNIFERSQKGPASVQVTIEELKGLGFDPHVFAELPVELQMEQLANARFSKSFGDVGSSNT